MVYTVPHYINGQTYVESNSADHAIYNPAFGEIIGQVSFATHAACDLAIAGAKTAGLAWSQTPPMKRAQVLFKFRELLEKYQLDLASIVTREHGKTIEDAKGSVARAIELVEFQCG